MDMGSAFRISKRYWRNPVSMQHPLAEIEIVAGVVRGQFLLANKMIL